MPWNKWTETGEHCFLVNTVHLYLYMQACMQAHWSGKALLKTQKETNQKQGATRTHESTTGGQSTLNVYISPLLRL
jgi:hypothetical protein